ncbi:MAG: hypothetical protein AAF702_06120 [Chloroflexota bacterium]
MKLLVVLAVFLLLLIVLALLAFYLERSWRQFQANRAERAEDGENIKFGINSLNVEQLNLDGLTASVSNWATQLRNMILPGEQDEQLVEQFRSWAVNGLKDDPELQEWLLALPEEGFGLLTWHIASFCKEMNFELAWLFDEQASLAPELKATIRSVVIDYCQACQRSVKVQEQAHIFAQYHQLVENPNGREQKALGYKLHENLASLGLADLSNNVDLGKANERERYEHILGRIHQAAADDWSQFAQVLQNTILDDNGPSAAVNGADHSSSNGQGSNASTGHTNGQGIHPTGEQVKAA